MRIGIQSFKYRENTYKTSMDILYRSKNVCQFTKRRYIYIYLLDIFISFYFILFLFAISLNKHLVSGNEKSFEIIHLKLFPLSFF